MKKIILSAQKQKSLFFVVLFLLVGVFIFFANQESSFFQNNDNIPQNQNSGSSSEKHSTVMKTNSWFSSVYKNQGVPSAPLFALPGAYQFRADGLAIGFPRAVATPDTVFGSFDPLCSVGTTSDITRVRVIRYGDWDAHFEVESGSSPWQVHMAQGSPVTTIDHFPGQLALVCQPGVTLTAIKQGLMATRGNERILIQAQGTYTVEQDPLFSDRVQLFSAEQSYRIMLLPQETSQSVAWFANLSWNVILDTQADAEEGRDDVIRTTYAFRGEVDAPVLTTLWPHHRLSSGEPEVLGQYETVLGTLRLIQTASFTTISDTPMPASTFERVTDPVAVEAIREAVRKDVVIFRKATPPQGVYFLGTWLGGVASVAQIAELYNMDEEKTVLLDILERYLVASLPNFTYQADTQMLVAKNTEFGNEEGNDHHFHYGYYLRASAVLATLRPALRVTLEPTMNELAGDIATTDRGSTRYPYIRNFSPYDGHSWADGDASFADGNNQESTSEALNAWYGVFLWGQVTGNATLERTGRTLFATELSAVKAYWFGENNPFPSGYAHTIASLVWGGKRDYATWFSGQAMHIHGIQWLPITPASAYLETLPNFPEREAEILRAHPNPATHEWGDLYAAVLSYSDPQEAVRLLPAASKNQAMKSTALLYQTVYRNAELFQ